jgi:Ser/Thr protein kinase RdoA (MazF antagonist)
MVDALALPVRYSIVDIAALERLITTLYGWENVRCQLIKGTMRDVYEVWANGQHGVLCIYRSGERRLAEIEAEQVVMHKLIDQGVAAPFAIPLMTGNTVFSLHQPEGIRFGALMTFVPGRPIGRAFDSTTAEQVGILLWKTHRALLTITELLDRPKLDFPTALSAVLYAFERAAPHRQAEVEQLHSTGDVLIRRAVLTTETAQYGLLHGDIIPSNILNDTGRLCLLDFDLCAYGWQLYDVASMLVEIAYWGMGEDVKAAFLRGYQMERKFTEAESAALPALQCIRIFISLGIPAQHIDTWGRVYFSDAIIDKQLTLLEQTLHEG